MRPRVCCAIFREGRILMVQHRDGDRRYWTLPGGGIEPGETPTEAAVREVWEETGLRAVVICLVYESTYSGGSETCFLAQVTEEQEAALGFDPEEAHLDSSARLLQGVDWRPLQSMRGDAQIARVLAALGRER